MKFETQQTSISKIWNNAYYNAFHLLFMKASFPHDTEIWRLEMFEICNDNFINSSSQVEMQKSLSNSEMPNFL